MTKEVNLENTQNEIKLEKNEKNIIGSNIFPSNIYHQNLKKIEKCICKIYIEIKEEISEENYIETADYEYVIKELVLNDNNFFTVYCNANIEEISGFVYPIFDVYMLNPEQAYQYCLSQIPTWSIEYHSNDHTALTI